MKNIIALLALVLSVFALKAQTEKGQYAIGLHNFSPGGLFGSSGILSPATSLGLAFGTTKSKDDGVSDGESKYTVVGLGLSGHYFIVKNVSIGLNGNVYSQTNKDDGDKTTITILMGGPEVRGYFPATTKSKFYVKGNGSLGSSKITFRDSNDDDNPTKLSQFGGGAGLAFFPNANISVDLGIGYTVVNSSNESTLFGETHKYKETSGGLAFDLGFTIFF